MNVSSNFEIQESTDNVLVTERHRDGDLQVVAQPLYLINEEVDVRLGDCRVGNDHTEKVDFVALRLVSHHGGP